jgi:hypothetical protein
MNDYLIPLIGGSGGGARDNYNGGGGGGAILIASAEMIIINGTIRANPGSSGGSIQSQIPPFLYYYSGNGSGGAIRLVAPIIKGTGNLSTGTGRIRLESSASGLQFTGNSSPRFHYGIPLRIFSGANSPTIQVTEVNGVAVKNPPTGLFDVPDAEIVAGDMVPVKVEANFIPVGAIAELNLVHEDASYNRSETIQIPLTHGTFEHSWGQAEVLFRPGFSHGFIQVKWDVPGNQ